MIVRNAATVTVKKTVSGASRRRGKDKQKRQPVVVITVDKDVMKKAHQVRRPGERLIILSATTVLLDHKENRK